MTIIETSVFTRQIVDLLEDNTYREFQAFISQNPNYGDIIKGSGGVRKVRWRSKDKGKSGGVRIIYYWPHSDEIFMLLAYSKSVKDDLTTQQIKEIRIIAKGLQNG